MIICMYLKVLKKQFWNDTISLEVVDIFVLLTEFSLQQMESRLLNS